MKKKVVIIIFACFIILFIYCYNTANKNLTDASRLIIYGNVDIREVALGFRVPGRLETLMLEEGDQVKTGDVMAVLDKRPFIEELNVSEAELKEVTASLNNAERNYERRQSLVKSGSASQSDFDDALALRDQLRAKLETIKARQKVLQTRLDDATLLASADGTITNRVRESGAILAAGAVVYCISINSPIWVRTYIDETNLGRIYPGQAVEVSNDSGSIYQGQIGYISPQAEFTPKSVETNQLRGDLVYRLRIVIDTPDKFLRQGMPVTIKINKSE